MDANLSRADLTRAVLTNAFLYGANFHEAVLYETELRFTSFTDYADFHNANLRKAWLEGTDFTRADLTGTDLSESFLKGAKLSRAKLDGAAFLNTDLRGQNLSRATLNGARLNGANLTGADLTEADFTGADLTGADLTRAYCLQTDFTDAVLTGCNVYGMSAWDVTLERAVQADLRITRRDDPTAISVDNLEVAQFLYVLLRNEKVRAVLDTITSKVVLILGRFSDERKPILDALREALQRHPNGYIPVLFDFEPQADKPILETVKTLANLARFVIADLTDPHMIRAELTAIIPNVPTVPIQPLIEGNADLPTEYESWALYKSFLPVRRYADLSDLLANLSESVIAPVEVHVHARRL
jgi:uncharacterized protein YjbI with pentapeptide repeats